MRKQLVLLSLFILASSLTCLAAEAVAVHSRVGTGATRADIVRLAAKAMQLNRVEADSNSYLGSEMCLACHPSYKTWKETQHAFAMIRPLTANTLKSPLGVIADTDQNKVDDFIQGLNFNNIKSAYDIFKPNAPRLSVKDGKYTISIGSVEMPVVFVRQYQESNGEWLQRFAVRIPVSDSATGSGYAQAVYLIGMRYLTHNHEWVLDGIQNYYNGNQPKLVPGMKTADLIAFGENYDGRCVGCHTTGIKRIGLNSKNEMTYEGHFAVLFQPGEPGVVDYDGDGNMELVNIGCESCHGPGGLHVMGGGDKNQIVVPSRLSQSQQVDLCGQCHSRLRSVPKNTFSWPFDDAKMTGWVPGSGPMDPFYVDANRYQPDGINGTGTHMQFNMFKKSAHYTNAFDKMTCTECHDPHQKTRPAQIVESITSRNVKIAVEVENNTLCLACHAGYGPFASITPQEVANYKANRTKIGGITEAHSFHPYGPERSMGLSRCTGCHFARTAPAPGGTENTVTSHTSEAISPQKTLIYQSKGGMPNSCAAQCHNEKVNSFGLKLDETPVTWNTAYDKVLAEILQVFYGPKGIWWKVDVTKP